MRAVLLLLACLLLAPAAHAATADRPWPPREGPGHLFVHYGEEHWNDIDGEVVLKRVVEESARYRPDLVTMSGDKTDDGTAERLEPWREIMAAYDRAGIPYMAGVGNHDGKQATPEAVTDHAGGATPLRDVSFYLKVFKGRPYPMGDAEPYADPLMGPRARPADDPEGASTHFYVDYGNVRWVFLDNSCYGIINCDPLQNPPDGRGRTQYEFLADAAREADAAGRLLFVVMHMPTRDPRDQQQAYYISVNHVMGKGISPDNQRFEQEAEALGVDAVFLGHIKGQVMYRGRGGIPYYIDGGAGGELYSGGPLGVDHGYWYGWRMIRVDGDRVEHDVIPVISPGGISVEGPRTLRAHHPPVRYDAFAEQPATKSDRAVVKALELRDPDPIPKSSESGGVPGWLLWLAPLALVPLLLAAAPRPRVVRLAPALGMTLLAAAAMGAVAGAQRSIPTSTPRDALPNPARIFTSGDPQVLAAVPSDSDDPRRDPASQTADGVFRPRCPGRTTLTVTSGHEETEVPVLVSRGGRRAVRSIRPRARKLRRGRRAKVAAVRLRRSAVIDARVLRRGKVVQRLVHRCRGSGRYAVRWTPRRRGAYTLRVRALTDRAPVTRRIRLRVR